MVNRVRGVLFFFEHSDYRDFLKIFPNKKMTVSGGPSTRPPPPEHRTYSTERAQNIPPPPHT